MPPEQAAAPRRPGRPGRLGRRRRALAEGRRGAADRGPGALGLRAAPAGHAARRPDRLGLAADRPADRRRAPGRGAAPRRAGRPPHPDPPGLLRPDRPAARARAGRGVRRPTSGPTPSRGWSTSCSPRPATASAGAATGSTSPATPTRPGDNSDYPIPEAYLYRDYVIDAFNADIPYDRFLHEQLAGDILAADGPPRRLRPAGDRHRVPRPGEAVRHAEAGGHPPDHRGHAEHDRPGRARPVAPLRPLPRPQVRPDHRARLLRPLRLLRRHEVPVRRGGGGPPAERVRAAGPARPASRTTRRSTPRRSPGSRRSSPRPRRAARPRERVRDLGLDGRRGRVRRGGRRARRRPVRGARRSRRSSSRRPRGSATASSSSSAARSSGSQKAGPLAAGPAGLRRPRRRADRREAPDRRRPAQARRRSSRAACRRCSSPTARSTCPPTGSGRLALARWLTEGPPRPLTARVMVNRIWQHHFGKPIVPTPSDFGLRGTPPTHPELLDWLAADFVASGWSIKAMHRRIMLSETYQLASEHDSAERRDRHRQRLVLAVRPPAARRRGPPRQPARPGRQPRARPARPAPVPGRGDLDGSPRTTSSRRSTRRTTGAST